MEKETYSELAQVWSPKIQAANDYYNTWAQRYKVDKLEEFYLGKQWQEQEGIQYDPYITNLVFSSIEVKVPSLLFSKPLFSVTPKPSKIDFDPDSSEEASKLRQDILNYYASDDDNEFSLNAELAILDAFFRFGIMEVGYSADWIENPKAGKPILLSDQEPLTNKDGEIVSEPDKIPQSEQIYVKRIPSKRFRVGGIDHQILKQCSWCGYWEFVRTEDLKANDNLQNTENIGASTGYSSDFQPEYFSREIADLMKTGDISLIWKIWDIRSKMYYIFDNTVNNTLFVKKYKRLPVYPLVFHHRLSGFYPLPPVFNWLSPQIEYNESREALRTHRRRFLRKFTARRGAFQDGELNKFIAGGDGYIGEVDGDSSTAIHAVDNAAIGSDNAQSLLVSKDDFNIVSGTTSEQRGQSDRTTATQASITDVRSKIRESRPQTQVSKWLSKIAKEILILSQEKLTLPFFIQLEADSAQEIGEITNRLSSWRQVVPQSDLISDIDFNVSIDVTSMSPVANEEEKRKFLEFISVLSQFPMISMSASLVKEAADRIGYRNRTVIAEFQKMAQLQHLAQLNAAQGAVSQAGQGIVAQNTPNTTEEIRNQMDSQGLVQ